MWWQHTTSQLMGIGFGKCDSYLYQNREGGFETHGEHNRHKWKLYCQSIWLYRCWTVARNVTFKGLLVVDGRSISSTNFRSHCLLRSPQGALDQLEPTLPTAKPHPRLV